MDRQADGKNAEIGNSIFRRLIRRQAAEDVSSNGCEVPCNTPRRSLEIRAAASLDGMPSSSRTIKGASLGSEEYVRDHSSILSLQPWIFRKQNNQNSEEEVKKNGGCFSNGRYEMDMFTIATQSDHSPRSVNLGYGLRRSRNFIRSRRSRRHSGKPLSAENCLIPQLYKDNFEIEEYVFSPPASPAATAARPFIVTNGNRVISKSNIEPLCVLYESGKDEEVDGVSLGVINSVVGVSPLPELRKPKRKSRELQQGRLDTSDSQRSCKLSHSQDSLDGRLLFSIGISIGVVATILSNRKELERLNDSLKCTQNLVQDLQEELEMKESLTVMELSNESRAHSINQVKTEVVNSFTSQAPTACFPALRKDESNQPNLRKVESISTIEAELQAELERLELNMNASSLEGRMAALGELNQDLIADVVHGELRADLLDGGGPKCQGNGQQDDERASTTPIRDTNYAVSPRELSLRLHEVIQQRLEERIRELERALQQSQKQLQFMEAEVGLSQRVFSSSDMGSSSNQESPTAITRDGALAPPLCMNLSGDALNAYDEAYEEFIRMADAEDNTLPTITVDKELLGDGLHSSDQSLIWSTEGGCMLKTSTGTGYFEREPTSEQILSKESDDYHGTNKGEIEDEYDDNEGKMLIKRIIERTRRGSPVILHAHKLFSWDE